MDKKNLQDIVGDFVIGITGLGSIALGISEAVDENYPALVMTVIGAGIVYKSARDLIRDYIARN